MDDRWVVGFDGSDESRAALEWAAHQSRRRGADLDVVHAHHEPLTDRLVAAITGRRGALVGHDDGGAAVAATGTDGDVEHRVVDGVPGHVLVDAARDASLLVVGRHGAGGGWRHALGSVSRYCVMHSTVPTVVVPTDSQAGPGGRVVVGFDGSAQSGHALRWAGDFCDPDADIRALIAIEVAPWLREDVVRARLGDEVRAEEQRLLTLLEAVDPEGRARPDVVIGDARPALARVAETSDLVVLGTHGSGRHGPALLGSLAGWMLDGSPTPVVVVPAPHTGSD